MAAYNRGDYVPAIQVFRGMARAGNAKAQGMLGAMYQRGQGVAKSSSHAFMWLSLAASRGDPRARAELKTVSATMTPEDLSRAREMMQGCEASDFRNCEYSILAPSFRDACEARRPGIHFTACAAARWIPGSRQRGAPRNDESNN